ncbi:hypothetical protein CEXT_596801 [Caerostris extrusa]|uniref:Uncharacterized protein n=1 Tax=Caerostris extrusa TaxID=172846 RepID=A0AAV4UU33_CAEEX|nr:hypothetical protein CEXT_596801 [Caerostris extrusa]
MPIVFGIVVGRCSVSSGAMPPTVDWSESPSTDNVEPDLHTLYSPRRRVVQSEVTAQQLQIFTWDSARKVIREIRLWQRHQGFLSYELVSQEKDELSIWTSLEIDKLNKIESVL